MGEPLTITRAINIGTLVFVGGGLGYAAVTGLYGWATSEPWRFAHSRTECSEFVRRELGTPNEIETSTSWARRETRGEIIAGADMRYDVGTIAFRIVGDDADRRAIGRCEFMMSDRPGIAPTFARARYGDQTWELLPDPE